MASDRSRVRSESPTRLEVRLLGAVEVILDGRRLGAFNSLRLQRFLALIALRRDPQHRSRLLPEVIVMSGGSTYRNLPWTVRRRTTAWRQSQHDE